MPSPIPPFPPAFPLAPEVASGPDPDSESPADPRANFRTKTAGTRLTEREIGEVEGAAKRAGKTLGEWLREVALKAARPAPDVNELLLEELAATRYMLLNLFHATAQAGGEGRALAPESVLRIRETADARKREQARKMLEEFFAGGAGKGSGTGSEKGVRR